MKGQGPVQLRPRGRIQMAVKSKTPTDKIKAALRLTRFPLSVVEFNTDVDRKKLRRFLNGETTLRSAEVEKVLAFFHIGLDPATREQTEWKNFAVNQVQSNAVVQDLINHSLAYLADGELASGTFVAIGRREFIATAAHTLPRTCTSLNLIGKGTNPLKREDIKVVAANRTKGGNPDVGYIEIEPGTTKQLGRVTIGVDRLCDVGPGQPGRTAFLYGCPFALTKHAVDHKRRETIIGIHSFTYPNCTLATDEWPSVPRSAQPSNKNIDLFIRYDVTEEMIGHGNRLPNPEGASGGGIWQGTGPVKGAVWHVGKVKLIAIQSAWDEKRKYIRGVQIKHWIRLIERDYPDLQPHVSKIHKL